jgi:plasmid stabilization system protein ParE
MKNTYKLIWSLKAVENLQKIINYLKENWSEKEIKNFSIRLDSYLRIIEKSPETFPAAKSKLNIRRAVLTKHNTLYYKVEEDSIRLLALFDNRQDPKKKEI